MIKSTDFLWMVADILDETGIPIGLGLVFAPILYDVFLMGMRDWQLWQINNAGVFCQLFGGFIVFTSWYIRKKTR